MKKFSIYALLFVIGCVLGLVCPAPVLNLRQTPESWVDRYGTNFLSINYDLEPEVTLGTTTYTGVTTNRAFLGGTGVTNTLVFKKGILVSVQ